eukprot:COSAG01_NODE_341_length_18611_cov_31.251513_8_plen_301_part_00
MQSATSCTPTVCSSSCATVFVPFLEDCASTLQSAGMDLNPFFGLYFSCHQTAPSTTGSCPLLGSGCADGTDDHVFSPTVSGCDGSWSSPGIAAGGAALCNTAAGWHVCASAIEVSSAGVTFTNCNCPSGVPTNTFYATMQSGQGYGVCGPSGTDDVWGCGCGYDITQCGVLHQRLANLNSGAWNVGSSTGSELTNTHKSAGNGGILCCHASASACADGTDDHVFSPTVVGCDGSWSSPGIAAGGAALCNTAAGWHVCASATEVSSAGVTSTNCNCPSGVPTNTFYATMQSVRPRVWGLRP